MHSSCLLLGVVTRDICSLNRIKTSIKNAKSGYQFKSPWCFHHCFSFWQTNLWWLLAVVTAISGKIYKRGERKRKKIWPTSLQYQLFNIAMLPCASVSKQVLLQNLSYETEPVRLIHFNTNGSHENSFWHRGQLGNGLVSRFKRYI